MEALSFLDPINQVPGVRADFVERIPGVEVRDEKDEVLRRLAPAHEARIEALSGQHRCIYAEQVHGSGVAVIEGARGLMAGIQPGMDGLLTAEPDVVLGIHVADCGAIWLADRETGAVGVLHSGKKGTESNILQEAVELMRRQFRSRPKDIVAVLGPCIRPPHYEVDFAAEIGRQADQLGLGEFRDCGIDTASDPDRYYSYRMEKGKTGRMLALIVRSDHP